jgi:hypothetical protein
MLPRESLRPVYIEMMYSPDGPNATEVSDIFLLAKGTGFFYNVDGQYHLVTARHNFSGKHWETNEFLHTKYAAAQLTLLWGSAPPDRQRCTRLVFRCRSSSTYSN